MSGTCGVMHGVFQENVVRARGFKKTSGPRFCAKCLGYNGVFFFFWQIQKIPNKIIRHLCLALGEKSIKLTAINCVCVCVCERESTYYLKKAADGCCSSSMKF